MKMCDLNNLYSHGHTPTHTPCDLCDFPLGSHIVIRYAGK